MNVFQQSLVDIRISPRIRSGKKLGTDTRNRLSGRIMNPPACRGRGDHAATDKHPQIRPKTDFASKPVAQASQPFLSNPDFLR